MAKILSQTGIDTAQTVEAWHVTQSIDAFTGVEAYDITLSGSFNMTGPLNMTGPINGEPGLVNPLTSSYAISASYAVSSSYEINYETSSSYAETASISLSSSYALSSSYVASASFSSTSSYINPLYQNVIMTGSLNVSSSAISFIKNDDGDNTLFTLSNLTDLQSRFISYVSKKMDGKYVTRKITNAGEDKDNFLFNSWISDVIIERDTFNGSANADTTTRGWQWFNREGGLYNSLMTLTASGSATSGRLGLGTGFSPTETLDVNGNARFRSITSNASVGALYYTSDGTLTTNTSDERLKENISPITNALDVIKSLNGITFQWKNKDFGSDVVKLGFIAQQVESIEPLLVFTNPVDGYKGIHTDGIIPLLVEALKEQQQEIDTLKSELAAIKTHLNL